MNEQTPRRDNQNQPPTRRTFLTTTSALMMAGGLLGGYGAFAYCAGRFLFPQKSGSKHWLYVAPVVQFKVGEAVAYRTPDGQGITITRHDAQNTVEDFLALSSVCPHLGCKVHWEAQNNRFFCPCHNGVFDPQGKAKAGPPADAKQNLPKYNLKVEKGLLYIEVGLSLTSVPQNGPCDRQKNA